MIPLADQQIVRLGSDLDGIMMTVSNPDFRPNITDLESEVQFSGPQQWSVVQQFLGYARLWGIPLGRNIEKVLWGDLGRPCWCC